MPVNPHDADELMRPFLGDVFEAHQDVDFGSLDPDARTLIANQDRALRFALQLLGVPSIL